jgi:hypothetical protein
MAAPRKKVRARTVEEVKILLDRAIESTDFEGAEEIAQELDDLLLLQDELNLSQVVSGYYEKKDALSVCLASNYRRVEQSTNELIEATKAKYQDLFNRKRTQQRCELDGLFNAWRAARSAVREVAEFDFQQSMELAKLIARDGRLKEAAQFREQSFRARVVNSVQPITALDAHYERRARQMIARHKRELNPLIQERTQEISELARRRDEQHGQSEQAWQVDNAGAVVGIRNSFKPTAKMPLSLAMQTVHPPPDPHDEKAFSDIGHDINTISMESGEVLESYCTVKRKNASARPRRAFQSPRSSRHAPRFSNLFREILETP